MRDDHERSALQLFRLTVEEVEVGDGYEWIFRYENPSRGKDTQEVRKVERGVEKGIGVSGVEGGMRGMRGTLLLCHSQDSNAVQELGFKDWVVAGMRSPKDN